MVSSSTVQNCHICKYFNDMHHDDQQHAHIGHLMQKCRKSAKKHFNFHCSTKIMARQINLCTIPAKLRRLNEKLKFLAEFISVMRDFQAIKCGNGTQVLIICTTFLLLWTFHILTLVRQTFNPSIPTTLMLAH